MEYTYDEDDYDYCPEDDWYEEPQPQRSDPPTGFLSLGPVWLGCSYHEYNGYQEELRKLLRYLTLEQAEELVNFACSLDRICPFEDNCQYMTRDHFHWELAYQAHGKDPAMEARHVAQLSDPSRYDADMHWFEMEQILVAQLTAAE